MAQEVQVVATRLLTADDLLTMPGDYELIRGELREVSPSSAEPTMVALNVGSPLHVFVGQHKLGVVTGADGGFNLFPDRRSVVAPDVGFIRRDRIPPGFDYQHYFPVPPDLAFEAVSPSDSFGDV